MKEFAKLAGLVLGASDEHAAAGERQIRLLLRH
jgi:hypothetical protein